MVLSSTKQSTGSGQGRGDTMGSSGAHFDETGQGLSTLGTNKVSRNPFMLPSDEEVFTMRETEHLRKEDEKAELMQKKVWQKTTASSRMGKTRRIKDIEGMGTLNPEVDVPYHEKSSYTRGLVAAATAAISDDRRREKENMSDFIEKKREMFLVQMALDTKREEIRKLEEKAQMKEEALRKSEVMLDEDAVRFDTFLKENDKMAHDAIKMAEAETKAKQDRVMDIKKLNQTIQAIQSDMTKLNERLTDCLEYKAFLDKLTPKEYVEEQKALKTKRKQDRLQARFQKAMDVWTAQKNKIEADWAAKLKAEAESAANDPKRRRRKKKKKEDVAPTGPKIPAAPEFDPTPDTSSQEEIPMYFKKPQTLLDIFTSLEEKNLFLIQNSQKTEQALEELRQQYRDTQEKMEAQTAALKIDIEKLKTQIASEEKKARMLNDRAQSSNSENGQEKLLKLLNDKVREVFKKCKAGSLDSNPSTLKMLTGLELKLEGLLRSIEKMDHEYVARAEKEKEQKRRERVRLDRIAEQKRVYEAKKAKSMERSRMPVHKKTGKQIMQRSPPLRKKRKETTRESEKDDELDERRYFA